MCRHQFGANKSAFAWDGWSQDQISRFDLHGYIARQNSEKGLQLFLDAEQYLGDPKRFSMFVAQAAAHFGRAAMEYQELDRIVAEIT